MNLRGKVVLAPMAGVTDTCFRSICREMGAALVFTEMISADGLLQNNQQTFKYLFFRINERPIGFQLFGTDPYIIAKAVEIIEPYQPDFIDLNFGCPVKKVVKKGAGAALLRDIGKLRNITEQVIRITKIPVFAKIRKGWDDKQNNALEVAKTLEQCGISAITVHPRTQAQQYRGHSDWEVIKHVKNAVSVPIIGNGDVRTAEDVQKMIEETGCDLVMIGRGSLGNPWIFREANYLLEEGNRLPPPILQEKLNVILKHLEDIISIKGEKIGIHELRKHLGWYTKGLANSTQIRAKLFTLKSQKEIKECLTNYFNGISEFEKK